MYYWALDHARKHSNDCMKDELLKASFWSLLAASSGLGTVMLSSHMIVSPPSSGFPPSPSELVIYSEVQARAGDCAFRR